MWLYSAFAICIWKAFSHCLHILPCFMQICHNVAVEWVAGQAVSGTHGLSLCVCVCVCVCADGSQLSAVKRLTDDKVLRAELTVTADGDEQHRQQVILYDKQLNINSAVAQKHVSFTADTCELSRYFVVSQLLVVDCSSYVSDRYCIYALSYLVCLLPATFHNFGSPHYEKFATRKWHGLCSCTTL